jgi:hypothetical protein
VNVSSRPLQDRDLDAIFEQVTDPESIRMAAFTADDQTDRGVFLNRMSRLRADQNVSHRVIDAPSPPKEVAENRLHRSAVVGARGVLDAGEWPVRLEPSTHGAPERDVQVRMALPHPGERASVVVAVGQRIDVDTPDHVAACRVEHRVREPLPCAEVVGVASEVCAVLLPRHLSRPGAVGIPGRRRDVVQRRRPGVVVPIVVLGPERLEDELRGLETSKSGGTKSATRPIVERWRADGDEFAVVCRSLSCTGVRASSSGRSVRPRKEREVARYLISFDDGAMDFIPDEDGPAVADAAHAVIREAQEAGVWVFAGGVYPHDEVGVRVVAPDGTVTESAESKAYIAGVTIIDVPSIEEALQWAAKIAAACRCPQEVREFGPDPAVGN